jgi:hypothetical protein
LHLADLDWDSHLVRPLNEIIRADDECIVGVERNPYNPEWCYAAHHPLSVDQQMIRFPEVRSKPVFENRVILNWCIMSAPYHKVFLQTLENFARSVELEYIGMSGIKMEHDDHFSKRVLCITGPQLFSGSVREVALAASITEGNGTGQLFLSKIRLGSRDFLKEGGIFKWASAPHDRYHYTRVHDALILSHYGNITNSAIAAARASIVAGLNKTT